MSATTNKPALLIALPSGLTTGGVQTWAVRCLGELSSRARAAGLLTHAAPAETIKLAPTVQRFDVPGPPLAQANGDLAPFLPAYRAAAIALHEQTRSPVIAAPNHLGDCYGLVAALTRELPFLRTVGWCHLDIPYDARVLEHYEPILHRVIPVSEHLGGTLRARLPGRAADVQHIPCGVEVPESLPARAPSTLLRIIYVGRLDDDVKRTTSLAFMSGTLALRGIRHTVTVVGDGPARSALQSAASRLHAPLTLTGPLPLTKIAPLLATHDLFVLPSRVEGLSLSMLEAMAAGCVPIVSRTDSGATQVIRHGHNGLLVEIEPGANPATIGKHMASAVNDAINLGLQAMSRNAWQTVHRSYSVSSHAEKVEQLLDAVAAEPARSWPSDRPAAFTSAPGAGPSGTVPPDAPDRLRAVLRSLNGRRVVLHGTGRHTLELAHVIAEFPATIIGFTDDDPARHGGALARLPIIAPSAAAAHGATDVVISSWLNQDAIWNGRAVYETQQLRVHRIYPKAA